MSRRGLITLAGGIALGGAALLPGLLADNLIRDLAEQQATGEPPILAAPGCGTCW
jgi:hypothetical protein